MGKIDWRRARTYKGSISVADELSESHPMKRDAAANWLRQNDRSAPKAPRAMSKAEIKAGMTEKGGFTRKQLEAWGVPWPPPSGWRQALLKGGPMPKRETKEVVDTTADLKPATCWCGTENVWAFLEDHSKGRTYCPRCDKVPTF